MPQRQTNRELGPPLSADRADFELLSADRARLIATGRVSRETIDRLDRFVSLLLQWQPRVQLVSRASEAGLWSRHIADSLQLLAVAPKAQTWVDLGTGGGFPGVVLACALASEPNATVHLVESNAKKASFLRDAINVTGAPAIVYHERIEKFVDRFVPASADSALIDVVTARALAPLDRLLDYAAPLLRHGTVGLFLKGENAQAELKAAEERWTLTADLVPSETDKSARIVVVRALAPRGAAQ